MRVGRLHLIELEDQAWFPKTIRDLGTDFLRFMGEMSQARPNPIARRLAAALSRTGQQDILDLCSGGGGPIVALSGQLEALGQPVRVTLTDMFPNQAAFRRAAEVSGGRITFVGTPVDASAVPEHLAGFRTLFNSLHHFRPDAARSILRDATRQGRPIAVFEVPQRTLLGILIALVFNPVAVLLATPFIRPFKWHRLLWTYPLPAVPLLVLWDGLVSALRAYSPEELRRLVDGVEASDGYTWDIGREPLPYGITYLVGCPPVAPSPASPSASREGSMKPDAAPSSP